MYGRKNVGACIDTVYAEYHACKYVRVVEHDRAQIVSARVNEKCYNGDGVSDNNKLHVPYKNVFFKEERIRAGKSYKRKP